MAMDFKSGRVGSTSIFDALSIGEGLVAAVLLWVAQFYHKVRWCFLMLWGGLYLYICKTTDIWHMVCPQHTPNTIYISAIWFSCLYTAIHRTRGPIFDQKIVHHKWCTIFFLSTLLNQWHIFSLDWCLPTSKLNGRYINIVRSMLGTYQKQ